MCHRREPPGARFFDATGADGLFLICFMNRRLQLRVRHSGLLNLSFVKDSPDGNLFIAEAQRHIPFAIERVYFINNLANRAAVRGKHAHRELAQAIFCINGSFRLHLDDGRAQQSLLLNDPARGILLEPMLWHTMTGFSYDCVILVFASAPFDESDYLRDYAEFQRLVARPGRARSRVRSSLNEHRSGTR